MITFSSDLDEFYVVSNKDMNAKIKIFDHFAINGVVHGIEHWLVPIQK